MKEDKAELFFRAWRLLSATQFQFEREYIFHPTRKWRFDFAFVAQRVAVEVDGGQYAKFGGRHSTDADREKLNHAAALGWRVFRFSPKQLRADPAGCVYLVERAL